MFSDVCIADTVEDDRFDYQRFASGVCDRRQKMCIPGLCGEGSIHLVRCKKGTGLSQLVFALRCLRRFVASSVVAFVNIEKCSVVVNERCSRRSPLLGLRGVRKTLCCPLVAAALASWIKSAIDFRYPRTRWKELSTRFMRRGNGIPYEIIPTPLFCNVVRRRCEKCLQRGDTREQLSDPVSNWDGSLRTGPSIKSLEEGSYSAYPLIDISRGDSLQGGFKGTESKRGLLFDICGVFGEVVWNDDSTVRCNFVVSLGN